MTLIEAAQYASQLQMRQVNTLDQLRWCLESSDSNLELDLESFSATYLSRLHRDTQPECLRHGSASLDTGVADELEFDTQLY
jgi:hypothetical protein